MPHRHHSMSWTLNTVASDLTRSQILQKMATYPETDISLKESELVNQSLRALADGKHKDPVEKVRLLCLSRGTTGILRLGRAFRRMDHDGHKALTLEEFIAGMQETGVDAAEEELTEIFDRFDTDGTGHIKHEFLVALRPPMSHNRISSVEKAFEKLDKIGDGYITVQDLRKVYSVENHPRYITGDLSKEQILMIFLNIFEDKGTPDGKITREEFMNYYAGVSASIDKDAYFDLMMRQTFKL